MLLRVLALASIICAASGQRYEALSVKEVPASNDLGEYEEMVAVVVDILPELGRVFKELSTRVSRSENPISPENMSDFLMAFIPITRKVLFAAAKVEGRSVSDEILKRLDRLEEVLPKAFKFMQKLQTTDFFGFENAKVTTSRLTSGGVSGSFIRMPNQRGIMIHHG